MKKEQKWKTTINGTEYEILCTQSRTKYELYVDGQLCGQINKSIYEENMEKDVTIDGKVCQFVVYGDEPDLVVDGVLQGVEAQERKTARFHKIVLIGFGCAQIIIGTVGGFIWFMLKMTGTEFIGGVLALVGAFLFAAAGVFELLWGLRKK